MVLVVQENKTCPICNKEFKKRYWNQRYCCEKCSVIANRYRCSEKKIKDQEVVK